MRLLASLGAVVSLLLTPALANTEKTIFVAPPLLQLPTAGPSLDALGLDTISATNSSLRTSLPVAFPTSANPRGVDHWYLLQGLSAGQRYEVRICWAAIQPTEFWLNTYSLTHVFDTPSLIQRLQTFSEHQQQSRQQGPQPTTHPSNLLDTTLFLQVQAAADFFTTDKILMTSPPSVDVEIILDPYLANVFPRSLLPTAIYLVALAISAWFVSGSIWRAFDAQSQQKQHKE